MTNAPPTPKKNSLTRLIPIAVIALVAVIGLIFLKDYLNFETLAAHQEALLAFRDQNYAVMLILFVAIYAVVIAFALPGAALASITGGFLFALFPGTVINMFAATLGATATFMAARYGFGSAAEEKLNTSQGVMGKIKRGIDENQWETILLVRLLPIFPFPLVNIALSACGVPLWRYVIGTFVGILPGAVVYTWIGAGLSEVFARGETPDLGIIFEPYILGPILGLCALAILPIAIKAIRGKKDL
ncbi:MAG: TVP38/TMEM64 family protein [Pseudomonadota bacterium]